MSINYQNTMATSKPLFLKNKSIDIRTTIDDISNYRDIQYPYIGMLFYAKNQDTYYKVQSLSPGYVIYSTNKVVYEKPSGTEYVDYETMDNVFIDSYKEFNQLFDQITYNLSSLEVVSSETIMFEYNGEKQIHVGSIILHSGNDIDIPENNTHIYNGQLVKVIEIADNVVTANITNDIIFNVQLYENIISRIEALEKLNNVTPPDEGEGGGGVTDAVLTKLKAKEFNIGDTFTTVGINGPDTDTIEWQLLGYNYSNCENPSNNAVLVNTCSVNDSAIPTITSGLDVSNLSSIVAQRVRVLNSNIYDKLPVAFQNALVSKTTTEYVNENKVYFPSKDMTTFTPYSLQDNRKRFNTAKSEVIYYNIDSVTYNSNATQEWCCDDTGTIRVATSSDVNTRNVGLIGCIIVSLD